MQTKNITNVGKIKLNSFRPLCKNAIGFRAITEKGLAPFIDSSCRREPDLEHSFPSISALCRQSIFAPHLRKGDVVVYITVKNDYPNADVKEEHHRLVAVLQVKEVFETHKLGANWYYENNLTVPSNCMIENNPPKLFDETAGNYEKVTDIAKFLSKPIEVQTKIGERRIELWDRNYQDKANKWGVFIVTEPIFVELNDSPIILEQDWINLLGKVPNTRNPNNIKKEKLIELCLIAGINLTVT